MADHMQRPGSGILRGLKRVLFTQDEEPDTLSPSAPDASPVQPSAARVSLGKTDESSLSSTQAQAGSETPVPGEMKLKVYQLLESLNKPGMDFFEVWNAAVEMGGANSANLRAAFTSLRFADKQLTKEHLLQSGKDYVASLQQVIDKESAKRQEEKKLLETQRENTRRRLDEDMQRIEAELKALEVRRDSLRRERESIDENFMPRIREIDEKIDAGQRAVNEVISEIQSVISLLQQDIN
jgi:hypothetical protein